MSGSLYFCELVTLLSFCTMNHWTLTKYNANLQQNIKLLFENENACSSF